MAESDCRNENSLTLSSSTLASLYSWIGNGQPVNHFVSQIQTMRTEEQHAPELSLETNSAEDAGSLEESSDSLSQLEDCSPPSDMSSALWSVSKLFSSVLDDEDSGTEGAADPAEEETLDVSFQSKYIHVFPLYQVYCLQMVKEGLDRMNKGFVSRLISPQYVQGLQSRLSLPCPSETASPQLNSAEPAPSSPPPQPIRVTPCTLWQNLDEVKASGLLNSLTNREIRLQETTFELIGSEASYLRSLGVAVNHFYASKALKQTLSRMEHHILFSNIRRVMAASEKFLMDLEIRLGENILISQVGDIVLSHCPQFHSLYVPYVTNMMYQEALVNQLLQQNRDFLYSIKKLESDPVCQRQSLKSFLVLPFQRITRIRLILESILKLTEPDCDTILNLEKAIEAIHEIVTDCDKGVRKMKQIEELVCLEMLLDFGKVKAVPLVVSGRFLVHQGPVRQLIVEAAYSPRVSFISIYLHLFNNLLIISTKKDQKFTVVEYAEFPTHVHLEHLKTEVLGLPPDSFLLRLSQSQTGQPTAMILVTHTRSDKEAWVEALSSKQ
ncbi:rho guanine nucleotide exchange factor 19 [Larimichthys crocea]|uniref:rho guanine nucleotide exchange factor 19 n=1 Tax=Larimichthys crocea TaxID=215358 RepID=UPI000F5DBD85|nr:rho guanine nucleotide exchange factor 19 [Larimichthys crocea]